jgi:rubrerythrin
MSELNFYTAGSSLSTESALDVEALELIYRLEMSGEHFYNLLADRVENEEAAALLRKNAVEERGHARRIARALSIKTGKEWSPTAEQEILLDAPMPPSIDAPLFLAVVKGEIDGDAGYQHWADLETNEDIARLLRLNGREETVHAGRAQQVYEILSR